VSVTARRNRVKMVRRALRRGGVGPERGKRRRGLRMDHAGRAGQAHIPVRARVRMHACVCPKNPPPRAHSGTAGFAQRRPVLVPEKFPEKRRRGYLPGLLMLVGTIITVGNAKVAFPIFFQKFIFLLVLCFTLVS
jgi:hypothetical protein